MIHYEKMPCLLKINAVVREIEQALRNIDMKLCRCIVFLEYYYEATFPITTSVQDSLFAKLNILETTYKKAEGGLKIMLYVDFVITDFFIRNYFLHAFF